MSEFKVGDKIKRIRESQWPEKYGYVGKVYEVLHLAASGNPIISYNSNSSADPTGFELVQSSGDKPDKTSLKSDGGPSAYYDLLNGGTLNDELEHKGDTQWLGDTFHLSNVVKAAWRWGIKDGTDKAYDARKLIYSGARLLMKHTDRATVRQTLQELLDNEQFKEKS